MVVGKTSFSKCRKVLSPGGYYLAVAGGLKEMLQMIRTSITGSRKVVFGGGSDCEKKENLEYTSDLLEQGALKPTLDRSFPFEKIVEAHRYVESGSKKGNVVLQIT
jgi:NADPH2:quinone reductase